MTASVASPALTMTMIARGFSMAATKSSSDSQATKSPSSPNSSTSDCIFSTLRLCTAVTWPWRAMLRARLRPITARPVTPMVARAVPVWSVGSALSELMGFLSHGGRPPLCPTTARRTPAFWLGAAGIGSKP